MPMSTLALMLQHDVAKHFPAFGQDLTAVFLAAVILMEIVGPIAVQWGLTFAGETEPETLGPASQTQVASKLRGT
jgi:hypothetical protein